MRQQIALSTLRQPTGKKTKKLQDYLREHSVGARLVAKELGEPERVHIRFIMMLEQKMLIDTKKKTAVYIDKGTEKAKVAPTNR